MFMPRKDTDNVPSTKEPYRDKGGERERKEGWRGMECVEERGKGGGG